MSQPPPYSGGYQQQGQAPPPAGWAPAPGQVYGQGGAGQQQYGAPPMPPPMMHAGGVGYSSAAAAEEGEAPKYVGNLQFNDKSIRAGFIRKVFLVLTIQLLVVAAVVSVFTFNDSASNWVRTSGIWMYYGSYVCFLVTYLALACCEGVRRSFPTNVICLAVLTMAIAFMTAMITAFYKTEVVFMTAGICAVCCFAIILFSMQTKYDFTSCMGVMFVVFMVVFLFGIGAIIISIWWPGTGRILYLVYAGAMAIIFMVYLAIDVQLVMGGRKMEISQEDWVFAAVQLFMDIIYIFWFLLQLIGGSSR